ncbi:hypothetical protein [Nannocystis punicea]|uniref:Uncharacterized protein n=1 Tax=Nannocystis punicea TaxID=2995304 RepID=A0ABY7GVH1_9BACT|nr:hypothetical protein [Nannocystis poenicansa]WAS90904.1 hypothetical protein O0S08_32345 [Nannocystis poenicansa]
MTRSTECIGWRMGGADESDTGPVDIPDFGDPQPEGRKGKIVREVEAEESAEDVGGRERRVADREYRANTSAAYPGGLARAVRSYSGIAPSMAPNPGARGGDRASAGEGRCGATRQAAARRVHEGGRRLACRLPGDPRRSSRRARLCGCSDGGPTQLVVDAAQPKLYVVRTLANTIG